MLLQFGFQLEPLRSAVTFEQIQEIKDYVGMGSIIRINFPKKNITVIFSFFL